MGNENDFSIESENVGLYKIKIDGSQKQKLQGNMEQPSGYEYQYNDLYKIYVVMEIICILLIILNRQAERYVG